MNEYFNEKIKSMLEDRKLLKIQSFFLILNVILSTALVVLLLMK